MAFGEPIEPVDPGATRASRKAAYAEVGRRVQASMMALYAELCETYGWRTPPARRTPRRTPRRPPFRRGPGDERRHLPHGPADRAAVVPVSASPVVLNHGRIPPRGPVLLAPNHLSHYDVPALMAETRRNIDFVSSVEFRRTPIVGPLFRAMNCMFLDRGRADPATAKAIVDRLRRGRLVAMFPEGGSARGTSRSSTATRSSRAWSG
jgi:1-acyl-sn-glycerol-3-phosphate acyltransferase